MNELVAVHIQSSQISHLSLQLAILQGS